VSFTGDLVSCLGILSGGKLSRDDVLSVICVLPSGLCFTVASVAGDPCVADVEVQLQEALVSTIAAIDPSLDDSFCATEAMEATEDTIALQADFIPLNASGMELDYLDADDDADTGLF